MGSEGEKSDCEFDAGEGVLFEEGEDDDFSSSEGEGEETSFQNLYRGFSPSLSSPSSLSLPLLSHPPSPAEFFTKYIATRTPCIFSFLPPEVDASSFLSLERLRVLAGDEEVEVEKRSGGGEREKVEGKQKRKEEEEKEDGGDFGLAAGPKIRMKFAEILGSFERKETQYYLSTQSIAADPFGFPSSLYGPPLHSLSSLFPLYLPLFEGLVLNNVNVWMGSYPPSPSPSSSPSLLPSPSFSRPYGTGSGLHHDFHDNLYILLRGQKTFQLLPPSLAGTLPMYGNPVRVHPNGLIQYAGSENMTRSDGVPMAALDRDHIESQIEIANERMEKVMEKIAAFEKKRKGKKGRKKKSDEEEMEEKMRERELEREREDAIEGVEVAEEVMEDYLEYELLRMEEEEGEEDEEEVKVEEDEKKEEKNEAHSPEKKRRKVSSASSPTSSSSASAPSPSHDPNRGPDHFCRLSVSELPSHFSSLSSPLPPLITCEIKSGQMLYLPASWFHSVFSANDPEFPDECHIALNYWFYPPDGTKVELPYRDSLLSEMFQKKYGNLNGKREKGNEKKRKR